MLGWGYLVSIFPFKCGCCWDLSYQPREDVSHWFDMVSSALPWSPVVYFFLGKIPIFWKGKFSIHREIIPFPPFFVGKGRISSQIQGPKVATKTIKKSATKQNPGGEKANSRGIELRTPASSDVFVGRFSNATKPQVFIEDLWRSVQKWWVYYWFLDYYGFTTGLLTMGLLKVGKLRTIDYIGLQWISCISSINCRLVDSFRLRQLPARPAFLMLTLFLSAHQSEGCTESRETWISTWQPKHGVALRVEGHAMGSTRETPNVIITSNGNQNGHLNLNQNPIDFPQDG